MKIEIYKPEGWYKVSDGYKQGEKKITLFFDIGKNLYAYSVYTNEKLVFKIELVQQTIEKEYKIYYYIEDNNKNESLIVTGEETKDKIIKIEEIPEFKENKDRIMNDELEEEEWQKIYEKIIKH